MSGLGPEEVAVDQAQEIPGQGEVGGVPMERLWPLVEAATARICSEDASRERLRNVVQTAATQALAACGRRDCRACDRVSSGLPCEMRKARHLGKRLLVALLPMMRRGCPFETARAILDSAAAGALGLRGSTVAGSGCSK
jgi:hypothetical protein